MLIYFSTSCAHLSFTSFNVQQIQLVCDELLQASVPITQPFTPVTTTTVTTTPAPTASPTTEAPTSTSAPTSQCFSTSTYDGIDADIATLKESIPDSIERSHFLGGIVRLAAHDLCVKLHCISSPLLFFNTHN